jgi:hypothetical protein
MNYFLHNYYEAKLMPKTLPAQIVGFNGSNFQACSLISTACPIFTPKDKDCSRIIKVFTGAVIFRSRQK